MELCMHSRPSFASDYMEGAHPAILARLMETNMLKTQGYGSDPFSQSAREKIRAACGCPEAHRPTPLSYADSFTPMKV